MRVQRLLSGITSQGIADARILIIDNASTDNGVEIARQLAAEDHRVDVVVHSKNFGLLRSIAWIVLSPCSRHAAGPGGDKPLR
jgi:glycosyltransferase involved in cell wall biosynthesis